jgi:hypothetical protein
MRLNGTDQGAVRVSKERGYAASCSTLEYIELTWELLIEPGEEMTVQRPFRGALSSTAR